MKSTHIRLLLLLLTSLHIQAERTTLQLVALVNNGPTFPETGPALKYLSEDLRKSLVARGASDRRLHGTLSANGLRMAHILGRILHDKFESFLGSTVHTAADVRILASSDQVSGLTAQALSSGLFGGFDKRRLTAGDDYSVPPLDADPPDDRALDSGLPGGYYPFAVSQSAAQYDRVFKPYTDDVCRTFKTFGMDRHELVKEFLAKADLIVNERPILQTLLSEINGWSLQGGSFISTPSDLKTLTDYLWSMRALKTDFGLPHSTYTALRVINMVVESAHSFSAKALQVQMAGLARLIRDTVSDRPGRVPVTLLSGGYLSVWALLQSLGLSSTQCIEASFNNQPVERCLFQPEFGANVVLELFREDREGPLLLGTVGRNTRAVLQWREAQLEDQPHRASDRLFGLRRDVPGPADHGLEAIRLPLRKRPLAGHDEAADGRLRYDRLSRGADLPDHPPAQAAPSQFSLLVTPLRAGVWGLGYRNCGLL